MKYSIHIVALLCIFLLLISLQGLEAMERNGSNDEALLGKNTSSTIEDYASFWREFPELFPQEKFYVGPEGKEQAREDKIIEAELADRARERGMWLDARANELLRRFEQTWLARKVYEEQVAGEITIKSSEVEDFYNAHRYKYYTPESIELGHIFVEVPPGAPEQRRAEAKKKIETAMKELEQGKSFEDVAKTYSEAESAQFGGRAGILVRGQGNEIINTAAFNLEEGEISKVVESKHGFHILKNYEYKAEGFKSLEDAATAIERQLKRERGHEKLENYLASLSRKEKVATYFHRLDDDVTSRTVLLAIDGKQYRYNDFFTRAKQKKPILADPSEWKNTWIALFKDELLGMNARESGYTNHPAFTTRSRWVENYLLSRNYLENVVYPSISVTEEEIREYYNEHKALFVRPARARCYVLSVEPPSLPEHPLKRHQALGEVKKGLQQFLQSVESPEQFMEKAPHAAEKFSGAQYFDTGMMVPASRGRHFDWAVEELDAGELSGVVEKPDGFYIIYCTKKEPRRPLTFEEAKDRAARVVRNRKMATKIKALRQSILEKENSPVLD